MLAERIGAVPPIPALSDHTSGRLRVTGAPTETGQLIEALSRPAS